MASDEWLVARIGRRKAKKVEEEGEEGSRSSVCATHTGSRRTARGRRCTPMRSSWLTSRPTNILNLRTLEVQISGWALRSSFTGASHGCPPSEPPMVALQGQPAWVPFVGAWYGCPLSLFLLRWPVTGRGLSCGRSRTSRPLTARTNLALIPKSATGNCVVNPGKGIACTMPPGTDYCAFPVDSHICFLVYSASLLPRVSATAHDAWELRLLLRSSDRLQRGRRNSTRQRPYTRCCVSRIDGT